MFEREKLPKLKTNSKLIKFQEEINGVIEELLEEEEMDITDINNLIYVSATIMTQTLNEPSKKNRRNIKFWKIRMQKQISNWRKERKLLTIHGQHHPKADVDRLYVLRKQGGRGVIQLQAAHAVEITKMVQYVDRKEDPLIAVVRTH
jgi:hypothetical protein